MATIKNTWFEPMLESNSGFRKISTQELSTWREHLVFDHCRGLTQGESFCDYFGIRDNLLLYNVIRDTSIEAYISDTYLETESLAN